jgi:putative ABC transport system ATP-binding protein
VSGPTLLPPAGSGPAPEGRPVVTLVGARKTYGAGETAVHALDGVDLIIQRGEYVAIMGSSGSG